MDYLVIEDLLRVYKRGGESIRALSGISFTIKEGDFVLILGPSGSGKTSLLNLLGGMDRADGGRIILNGNEISSFHNKELTQYRRKDIGFVFQFYNLISTLNAKENVKMSERLGKEPFDSDEMLDEVGLSRRKSHFPGELSGGELQRVAIARALVKNPSLILCDEPTGALDSANGQRILVLLKKMAQNHKKTIIVVSHNGAIAPAADQVIHLRDGKISKIDCNHSPIPMEKVVW